MHPQILCTFLLHKVQHKIQVQIKFELRIQRKLQFILLYFVFILYRLKEPHQEPMDFKPFYRLN